MQLLDLPCLEFACVAVRVLQSGVWSLLQQLLLMSNQHCHFTAAVTTLNWWNEKEGKNMLQQAFDVKFLIF